MILITMGTQPIRCDRILEIAEKRLQEEEVIFQVNTDVDIKSSNIKHIKLIGYEEMMDLYTKAEIIVTSGTGSIINALKLKKKVIIFPRLFDYGEAVDNHGKDMKVMQDEGYCEYAQTEEEFISSLSKIRTNTYKSYKSNNVNFVNKLETIIKGLV